MEEIILSPRLRFLADWVPLGSNFADIGTDHGYLPLFLKKNGRISSVIATDINVGPLEAGKKIARKHDISLDFRLCDGLEGVFPKEVDCISIAGMGGMTISQILAAWLFQFPQVKDWQGTFLLQPMSTQRDLRFWLNTQGFTILEEGVICEGDTLYTAMKVRVGEDTPYAEEEYLFGRQSVCQDDRNRLVYLEHTLGKIQKIYEKLGPSNRTRQEELKAQEKMLLKMKKELET